MPFNPMTKNQVRLRQWGKCARCGQPLHGMEEFAHHLWPELLGGTDEENNCVILCDDCHDQMLGNGNSVNGMTASHIHFPFANIYGGQKRPQARAAIRTR